MIGIDGEQELALSLFAIGHSDETLPGCIEIEEVPPINFEVVPLSISTVDYPSIRGVHAASSLTDYDEARGWRRAATESKPSEIDGEVFPLLAAPDDQLTAESIEDVIQRRASTRRFARKPMPFTDLSTIIDRATQGIPADFLAGQSSRLNDIYAIVNRIEGLPAGAYFVRTEDRALELLKPGDFSAKAAYLTLDQDLGGDASVTFFFMASLEGVYAAFGNRGYRVAQMEAGTIGGKMYLAGYSLKRGATGLTFFDDDVTEFFSPHAAGKSCMLVVSIGLPGKRPLH